MSCFPFIFVRAFAERRAHKFLPSAKITARKGGTAVLRTAACAPVPAKAPAAVKTFIPAGQNKESCRVTLCI